MSRKNTRLKPQSAGPVRPSIQGPNTRSWRLVLVAIPALVVLLILGLQAPYWIAVRALNQRDSRGALAWLAWAERCGSDRGTIALTRNRVYRQLGEFDNVRDQLLLAKNAGVSQRRLQREEWLAFAQSGQMAVAEPHLADLLTAQDLPVGETCAAYVAGFLLTARPGEALQLIEAWLKDEPTAHQAYYLRGQAHASVKQFEAAEVDLQKAAKYAPHRPDVALSLGEALLELQRPESALPYFRKAAEDPDFPDADRACLGWARAARRSGDGATAERLLTELTTRHPDRAEAWEELGRTQFDHGATDLAISSLEEAVRLQPGTVSARQALGTMLAAGGRPAEAQPHLDYTTQALADLERLRKLEDAAEKAPRDVATRWEIAQLYRQYDTPDQAMAWARSVLLLDSTHPGAQALLARQGRNLEVTRE